MTKLFLDIETIPAEAEKHEILKKMHKKRLEDGRRVPESFEEYLGSTNFDGAFGRIACISFALEDNLVQSLSGDEKKMLQDFWAIAKTATLFVGFNVMDFDLRFIYQRSVVLNVRPTQDLSFARYRNSPIFDLMYEWSKWNMQAKISLDSLAHALGLPSSKGGEIEGKNVAQAFEDGRIAEICRYCEADVELTRKIYRRIIFDKGEQEELF